MPVQVRLRTPQPSLGSNWEYLAQNVETCAEESELAKLEAIPKLVVFLDNVNAVQRRQSRIVMRQLVESVRSERRSEGIELRRVIIDSDDSSELVNAIADWISDQDTDENIVYSGYGAVLWVRNGTVLDSVNYAYDVGISDVLSRTHRAFAAEVK